MSTVWVIYKPNVGLMLAHRLRRCANIDPALGSLSILNSPDGFVWIEPHSLRGWPFQQVLEVEHP